MDWGNWTPTSENINALPLKVREYIRDVETLCDPSGMVQENVLLKETVGALLCKEKRRNKMSEKPRIPNMPAIRELLDLRDKASYIRFKCHPIFNKVQVTDTCTMRVRSSAVSKDGTLKIEGFVEKE